MADGALDFYGLTRGRLAALLAERFDAPAFRAGQIFRWVYGRGITDFELMSDMRRELRAQLSGAFVFARAVPVERLCSGDGTRKFLLEFADGRRVETVLVKQPDRTTLCLSSQVGCALGCAFCRTATMGLVRSLSACEIVQQVLAARDDCRQVGDGFENIVFMGMGEPLQNLEAVADAAEILSDQFGLGLSPRKITVSTAGWVPGIERFVERGVRANLAVSLNAADDELRSRLMPVNRRHPLADLISALRKVPVKRRRRITIQYVLLAGVNDSFEQLERLTRLLGGLPIKVNLIPYNSDPDLGFSAPEREKVEEWARQLRARKIDTTLRWSKGSDIRAACGQLIARTEKRGA